jgi:hypothetical protein
MNFRKALSQTAFAAACMLSALPGSAQTKYTVVFATDPTQLPFPASDTTVHLDPLTLPAGWNGNMNGWCNGGQTQVGAITGNRVHSGGGGAGTNLVPEHAFIWINGSPAADLQNSMVISSASGCDGNVQVGTDSDNNGTAHAVMWAGTAKSEFDLNAGPYLSTSATSVKGNTQLGIGSINVKRLIGNDEVARTSFHAILWHGTPNSILDLHPADPNCTDSFATAGTPTLQYGYCVEPSPVTNINEFHAYAWSSTAGSAVDLHQYVPAQYATSQATYLDPATGVITGYAIPSRNSSGPGILVQWIPQ